MDTEDLTIEQKCEHLMNVVVESRKHFGKMCVDYEHKTSLMENKLLNLQLETISNYRFKPKQSHPDLEIGDDGTELDGFVKEMEDRGKRLEKLQQRLKETQKVVMQINNDFLGKKVHEPLSAEAMLLKAKAKRVGE